MTDRRRKDAPRERKADRADAGQRLRPWPFRGRKKPRKTFWESTRETFDSILIALVLASVFRTFVMEAFEIPTGSMAPTLYGRHVDVRCPRCSHFFSVGLDERRPNGASLPAEIVCPMCGSILDPARVTPTGGDRILVDKAAYTLNNPKRWDVGVFVNPHKYEENYIKRIAGLPKESVEIRSGDLFINGRIAQKPDDVQSVLWMPVFDSNFPPEHSWEWETPWTEGTAWGDLTQHVAQDDQGQTVWVPPWRRVGAVGRWELHDKVFTYRPDRGDTSPSIIRFAWKVMDTYGYGQRSRRLGPGKPDTEEEVGDIRLRADVTLASAGLILATIVEDDYRIDYVLSGDTRARSVVRINGQEVLSQVDKRPLLVPGRSTAIAFVNVDDRAWLEVDGRRPLGVAPDYPDLDLPPREETVPAKSISLGAAGAAVTFANVRVDRDIYYTRTTERDAFAVAGSRNAPYKLGEGEYFALGDHSPSSSDSRRWASPVIPRDHFIGKALVLYWPHKRKLWRIKFIR